MWTRLATQCAWAFARALVVAACAVLAGLRIRDLLSAPSLPRRTRTLGWMLLSAPFAAPALLAGYAYAPLAAALVRSPNGLAAVYSLLLWWRLTPLAVVALILRPPALSDEARHAFALLPARPLPSWWFNLRAAGRAPWIAAALVFVFTFGEFEMASLWGVKTWTVTVFDAQAGGLALPESLCLAVLPATAQAAVLLAALLSIARAGPRNGASGSVSRLGSWARRGTWLYLWLAALAGAAIPVAMILTRAIAGAPAMLGNFSLGREIAVSLSVAALVAIFVSAAAPAALRLPVVAGALALPGLSGGLLLSLGALALFQTPPLRAAYDTPLPWLLALMLLVMPFGLLLASLHRACRPAAALHVAALSGSRRLQWDMDGRARFWAAFALFCLAYFDLTTGAMLAPAGLTPVFVRLYNLMHYGQSAVLSAMACAAFAAPAGLALGLATILRGGRHAGG